MQGNLAISILNQVIDQVTLHVYGKQALVTIEQQAVDVHTTAATSSFSYPA